MTQCQPDFTLIAQRIKEKRTAKGMTQEKLAEHADVSTNFIGYVETGRKRAKFTTLWKIAAALDTTIDGLSL